MKKLAIVFIFFTVATHAQTSDDTVTDNVRQKFKTGLGIAFTSNEAMWGYSLHSEYHYFLNGNVSVATGLAVMHFRDDTEKVLKNTQIESLELGVYFHFLKNEDLSFHLGGGGNLRYFHWGLATSVTDTYTFDGEVIPMGSKKSINRFTAGYSVNAGFSFRLGDKMRLLFQEQLQNDKKDNITWDSRIGVLIKF
ncbi:MAG: hypothetical protein K9I68_02340 [Bacteroidales bacterium]|nr:hypothetical protein [Bacteroidales bacterium]MCF8338854.1 hypothetical protein [Bacteroidales bacterium]